MKIYNPNQVRRPVPRPLLLRPLLSRTPRKVAKFVGFCFCLSVISAGQVFASEQVTEKKSLDQATQSLKLILQQATQKGFVTERGDPAAQAKAKLEGKRPEKMSEFSCVDARILDFKPFVDIETFEHLILKKREFGGGLDIQEVEILAETYISLGMGAEAVALLRPYKSPRHRLLSRAGSIISGDNTAGERAMFSEISTCGASADLWASVETPTRLGYTEFLEGFQTLEKEMDQYPPFLRTYLTLDLAIGAAENGNLLLSNRLWNNLVLKDMALENRLKGDHSQLYLTALRSQSRDRDRALQIFKYLGERDGLYRAKSLKALASFKYDSGDVLSADMETDLQAITIEQSGGQAGRQAAIALIKNRIAANLTIDAIRTTKKMLQPQDPEFVYMVDIIAEHVEGLLGSETSAVKLLGLNSYLEDPEFFQSADREAALQRAALLAALTLDLPELGTLIYRPRAPSSDEDRAFLAYATALGALKHDGAPEDMDANADLEQIDRLRREVILTAFRLGDFTTASKTISTLPAGPEKENFQTHVAWLQGEWRATQKSLAVTASDTNLKSEFAVSDKEMVNFLNNPKITSKRATGLKSPIDVAAFVADLNADISTVQEYLDNG